MADDNAIIEGTVKFRDGKKWKSRWCVMRKLSPVADCIQLQLYRSARGRGGGGGGGGGRGRGACCAALSLQHFLGAESGFTLDKHSNTLALICRDLVAVLAFETRERLIQWQVKLTATLGESRVHVVVLKSGPAAGRGGAMAGPARLHVLPARAALTAGAPPRLLGLWELQHLRRYGVVDGRFCFEGGSLCGKGEGLHVLVSDRPQDILRDFELAARGRLSPRRRSLAPKRTEEADRAVTPSPAENETVWGGARPEAGAEDTASLRAGVGGERIALERCMSCMSKLGALSRSSTAALTPGAKHFNPAWTMEALSEPPAEIESPKIPQVNHTIPRLNEMKSPVPERPARPARLDLPRCSCEHVTDDCESTGVGPYENYDVPRVPSTEVEGEYYDTPKRLRECFDNELFRITKSSTANTLILKKSCGCLLRFGKKRREAPTVVDTDEDFRAVGCPCQRVTDWANNWIKLPYCRRNTASSEPSTSDKENVTPDASALYATVDFSRKTRRKACAGQTVEIDEGPLAHYENLNFALSLEYYENAKDMLRKAGVTQKELNAISTNLKPGSFVTTGSKKSCVKCGNIPKSRSCIETNEYLMMEPNTIENNKLEQSRTLPSGYTPMSPVGGFAFHTLKHSAKSPFSRLLEEKSASNPTLCGGDTRITGTLRTASKGVRPRSSSADSSRFLDEVKEFDGSVGGSASSLETLRDATTGGAAPDGKLSDVDSSEASKGRGAARGARSPSGPARAVGGNRDSSSSNDSGVSSWSLRPARAAAEYELPRCSAAARRHWRASRRPPPAAPRPPRPHSSDAPRVSSPPDQPKSSSAEAEVPLLTMRPLKGVGVGVSGDSRSTSSGASDMSDYIETLSLCSSHSSSDTPVTMRALVTSTLRPRSGKEYARLAPAGGLRPAPGAGAGAWAGAGAGAGTVRRLGSATGGASAAPQS